jgi:hypothetical protein
MTRGKSDRERQGGRPQHDEQAAAANPPGPGGGKLEDLERIERQVEAQAERARKHAPGSGPAAVEEQDEEDARGRS